MGWVRIICNAVLLGVSVFLITWALVEGGER